MLQNTEFVNVDYEHPLIDVFAEYDTFIIEPVDEFEVRSLPASSRSPQSPSPNLYNLTLYYLLSLNISITS